MGVKDFMTKFPLNLIIFSTTMGHGGEHTYSNVIENYNFFRDIIDSNNFQTIINGLKVQHAKVNFSWPEPKRKNSSIIFFQDRGTE